MSYLLEIGCFGTLTSSRLWCTMWQTFGFYKDQGI